MLNLKRMEGDKIRLAHHSESNIVADKEVTGTSLSLCINGSIILDSYPPDLRAEKLTIGSYLTPKAHVHQQYVIDTQIVSSYPHTLFTSSTRCRHIKSLIFISKLEFDSSVMYLLLPKCRRVLWTYPTNVLSSCELPLHISFPWSTNEFVLPQFHQILHTIVGSHSNLLQLNLDEIIKYSLIITYTVISIYWQITCLYDDQQKSNLSVELNFTWNFQKVPIKWQPFNE